MKFFDTNVLVYVADIRDPQKQRIAEDLVTNSSTTRKDLNVANVRVLP